MKKIILHFLILFVMIFPALAQNRVIREHPDFAANIQLAETWISEQMAYFNLPGLVVGIVYDRDLIWAKGFGYADLAKKTSAAPQTIFRIASITKLFTCTAIMQLRDQGKLQLDDPIKKYLPWFKIKSTFPDAPPVTIRHLMTHTSGLPREAAFPYWTDHRFPSLEEIIQTLPNQETIYPSETKWKYSNLGMALLGEIVVAASGENYETYIQNYILKPLNMNSTCINLNAELKKRLATGYGRRLPDGTRKVMPFTDSKGLTAAANMSSTVEDLARFASFQFCGQDDAEKNQILKYNSRREMQRVHWLQPSWKSGWGLGFSISYRDDKTFVGHGGWVAGYRTQITLCPDKKIAVIVMSNAEDGSPSFFANKIFDLLFPSIQKAVAPEPPVVRFDSTWKKYVGKYADPTDWEYEVMILNDALVLYGYDYPPEENPAAGLIQLTPEGAHRFRMTGENGDGELMIFEMDANGNVNRIKKGENYIYPIR